MISIDLFELQRSFNAQRIMLCFNGPLSASLIEEIGKALRNYLESQTDSANASTDVFAAYIELTQNIRHYNHAHQMHDSPATVVVGRDMQDRYLVCAGNIVLSADGENMLTRVAELAQLDKTQLRQRYKEQMRQARAPDSKSGAGLGLIDLARKASAPIAASLQSAGTDRSFLSFMITI